MINCPIVECPSPCTCRKYFSQIEVTADSPLSGMEYTIMLNSKGRSTYSCRIESMGCNLTYSSNSPMVVIFVTNQPRSPTSGLAMMGKESPACSKKVLKSVFKAEG